MNWEQLRRMMTGGRLSAEDLQNLIGETMFFTFVSDETTMPTYSGRPDDWEERRREWKTQNFYRHYGGAWPPPGSQAQEEPTHYDMGFNTKHNYKIAYGYNLVIPEGLEPAVIDHGAFVITSLDKVYPTDIALYHGE